MFELFYNIVYVSIIASILGIIVLILRRIYDNKISPTWKFAMWILVLISLLVPTRFTLQSKNTYEFLISGIIDKIELLKENFIANQNGKIIIYIWLIGIILLTIYYISTTIFMNKRIGKNKIEDENILNILEDVKKQMKIKRNIKLIKQNYKKVPCIYGIFSPSILLTDEILEKDEKTLKYIFLHELAHFKRKDLITNTLLVLIMIIHWFNPILWICFKQVRQDMELKTDEMVLNKIKKEEEKEYAKTLVELLPISQKENQTVKLLCVTDGKKNMERRIKMIKLSDKFKEYKTLIGLATLLIVLSIGTFIFTRIEPKNEQIINHVQYFETPDRIIYKEKDKDNYYVFISAKQDYTDILNKLIEGIDSIEAGEKLSEEEIKKIEENENYIELDYDTISKNYIIAYEKENYNVIKRNENGGEVVKTKIKNAEQLGKMIQEKISNNSNNCYHMKDSKQYTVKNEISKHVLARYISDLKVYENGIYGIKIQNVEKLNEILKRYDIELEDNITSDIFEKADIIIMISQYDIESIETRIGGIDYNFTGKKREDTFVVNIFAASKAINTNCIYRNINNTIK